MKKIIISFLLFSLILLPVGVKADTTTSDDIPAIFQIGQPIVIDLIMPEKAESVRIKWQDLETVLSQKDSSNSENIYTCLLGTDLKNAKPGLYKLEVFWLEDNVAKTIEYTINLTTKEYPIEKLTVSPKMTKLSKETMARVKKETEMTRTAIRTNTPGTAPTIPFVRPVPGKYTSPYGKSRYFNGQFRGRHGGVDMKATPGTPIKATADGTVVLTGNFWFAGRFVMINHGAGLVSFYCHMSKTNVEEGQKVDAGSVIGLSGQSGRVTGPHLHFSLSWKGQFFDPRPLLENTTEKIILQIG